jgi:hypothetical protein
LQLAGILIVPNRDTVPVYGIEERHARSLRLRSFTTMPTPRHCPTRRERGSHEHPLLLASSPRWLLPCIVYRPPTSQRWYKDQRNATAFWHNARARAVFRRRTPFARWATQDDTIDYRAVHTVAVSSAKERRSSHARTLLPYGLAAPDPAYAGATLAAEAT